MKKYDPAARWDGPTLFLTRAGRFNWADVSGIVSDCLPGNVLALARGNTIVISRWLADGYRCGAVSDRQFSEIVWHEVVHLWQQAELAVLLGFAGMGRFVEAFRAELETQAYRIASSLVESGHDPRLFLSRKGGGRLCPDLLAPAQAWMVGGPASKLLMANKVPENTLEELRQFSECESIEIYGPVQGAHEKFTADALSDSCQKKQPILFSDYSYTRSMLEVGSRFNDCRFYSNVPFGIHYFIQSDVFINQSHRGDMQYLHAMGSSEGDYQLDKKKILRWTRFCIQVYRDRKLRKKTFGDYVFRDLQKDDILLPMLASLMADSSSLKTIDSTKNFVGSTIEARQFDRAKRIQEYLVSSSDFFSTGFRLTTRSSYYSNTIGSFFSDPLVAIGTVCHMIQDSFAASHARRVCGVKISDTQMNVGEICVDDEELNRASGQTKLFSLSLDDMKKDIQSRITPILLFADYTQQDQDRHAYADVFLAPMSGAHKGDPYAATLNARLARDCTAVFLYMVFNDISENEIVSFIDSIFPLAEINNKFLPTLAGYPYEAVTELKDDKNTVVSYARDTLKDIGPNVIEQDPGNRLRFIISHIQSLDTILAECRNTPFEKKYLAHLNEISMELHEMDKLAKKNSAFYGGENLNKAIEAAAKVYKKLGLCNPLIMRKESVTVQESIVSQSQPDSQLDPETVFSLITEAIAAGETPESFFARMTGSSSETAGAEIEQLSGIYCAENGINTGVLVSSLILNTDGGGETQYA